MSKKEDDREIKKEAFLKAMESNFGNITKSCKAVGIDRSLPYKWAETDEEFNKQFKSDQFGEIFLDFIDDKLAKLAKDENPTVLIFLAKTKGKHRGYIERSEVTNTNINHNSQELSKEQMDNLIEKL